MICPHQGVCGGCALPLPYKEQLTLKESRLRELLGWQGELAIHDSPLQGFRARAEFRIYRQEGRLSYAMHQKSPQTGRSSPLPIQACPILLPAITRLMPPLLAGLQEEESLHHKLFGVEFLSGLSEEVVVSLLYHKRLDEAWEERAQALRESLRAFAPHALSLIGRSRAQKVVLGESHLTERLTIEGREWRFLHAEGSFTQPNPWVNEKMIEWILPEKSSHDLLELYCGAGNFTLPLSQRFAKVLATEVSKTSIHAALQNCAMNGIENIRFVRLNASETQSALNREREFNRLEGIALDSYDFRSVFVDPPRAGLGEEVARFLQRFETILYISCNPETLRDDLAILAQTHEIERVGLFDQFPYTPHMESGVVLRRTKP